MSLRPRGLGLAAAAGASLLVLALAGCSSGRIDPPRNGESEGDAGDASGKVAAAPDSIAAWALRARDLWASGDSMRADAAGALAREAFNAAWAQAADDRKGAEQASTTERLPTVLKDTPPTREAVSGALTRVGLTADIVQAEGRPALWQVVVSDPVGSASAATEFWAWPDTKVGGSLPTLQAVPPRAPGRRTFGPDAVGGLVTWTDGSKARLVTAWARPRGRGGLVVAVAERRIDALARWAITTSQSLALEVDSVGFVMPTDGRSDPPVLLVTGAGARDRMFDDCPTCPHEQSLSTYVLAGGKYGLVREEVRPSPYSALVAFLHSLREGVPESTLPYVVDGAVIDAARGLGLDHGTGALRAVPGTTAQDVTQRYRTSTGQGLEFTLEPRGDHWVVGDVRAASVTIE